MLKFKYECDKCEVVATQLSSGAPKDWLSLELTAKSNGVYLKMPGKLLCPECALKMGINTAEKKIPANTGDKLYDLVYEIGCDAAESG